MASKIKTYVITLAKNFPGYHKRKGDKTNFEHKYWSKEKIHTIRGNYPLWKKRLDKVIKGEAILSIREWSGKPYNSKQRVIQNTSKVGYQKISIKAHKRTHISFPLIDIKIDGQRIGPEMSITINTIVKNDGFDHHQDFFNWFKKDVKDGIIIHFTDLKY